MANSGKCLTVRLIGFLENLPDFLGRLGLPQQFAEQVVAELPRDIFQHGQMVRGPVRGRHQSEQELNRLAVQAVEIDAFPADCDRAHRAGHGLVLGMGQRHPARPIPVLPRFSRSNTVLQTDSA